MRNVTSLFKVASAALAFVALSGVASIQPAYAEDFNKLSLSLNLGADFDGVAQTYTGEKVDVHGVKVGVTVADGLESSWGGIIRGGVSFHYSAAEANSSGRFTFWMPEDTSTATGNGTFANHIGGGFGWQPFVEVGYRLNPYVVALARLGYECDALSWREVYNYGGAYKTSVHSNATNMCGLVVGGSVAIDPDVAIIPPLSLGAYYHYGEGHREVSAVGDERYTYGPTKSGFSLMLSARIPVEKIF